jgi:hypothetical protein
LGAPSAAAKQPAQPVLRTGKELEAAVHAALRRWVKPSDADAGSAAREFLRIYYELAQDKQLGAVTREELRNKVRNRLAQLADQIRKRIARETRLAKAKGPKKLETPADKTELLAQLGGAGGQPAAGAGGQGQFNVPDNGQELVDLIQSVIAPSSWDINGGPGSIYYWRPFHALVVRQTGEVHEQIGGTLEQLEKASR